MNTIYGAFVLVIAGAAQKRLNGLAWKTVRGLRAGQMHTRVSWEPGRSGSSFFEKIGQGAADETNPRCCSIVSNAVTSLKKGHKRMEYKEGIVRRKQAVRDGNLEVLALS